MKYKINTLYFIFLLFLCGCTKKENIKVDIIDISSTSISDNLTSNTPEEPSTAFDESSNSTSGEVPPDENQESMDVVPINDLKIMEADKTTAAGFFEYADDTCGYTYDNCLLLESLDSSSYVTFYLGKQYTKFTFTYSCPDWSKLDPGINWTFDVSCNNKSTPAYSSTMGPSTVPTTVDLDVTDVETLTFRVNYDSPFMYSVGVIISNGTFYSN